MQAPGYSKVISRPMDFMTMHARFEAGAYSNWDALRADLDTMFSNAMTFNAPATVYHKQARYSSDPVHSHSQGHLGIRERTRHCLPQACAWCPALADTELRHGGQV